MPRSLPAAITALAVFDFAVALTCLAWGELAHRALLEIAACFSERYESLQFPLLLLLAAAHLGTGIGLLRRWRFAWIAQLVLAPLQAVVGLALVHLFPVPIALVVALVPPALAIWYLTRLRVRGESGAQSEGAPAKSVLDDAVVTACIVSSLGLGMLVPSMLLIRRPRVSANALGTIGDIRAVLAAQVLYAEQNEGAFDSQECLAVPQSCLAAYPADGAPFVDPNQFTDLKSGHRRAFHPGPRMAALSATSISSFAMTAIPLQTGCRSFCGDTTGNIWVCRPEPGQHPAVVEGRCQPQGCTRLQ